MKDKLIEAFGEDYIKVVKNHLPFVDSQDDLERMWRQLYQPHGHTTEYFVNLITSIVVDGVVTRKVDFTSVNIMEVNKVFPNVKTHSDLIQMYAKRYSITLYEGYDIFLQSNALSESFIRYLMKSGVQI